MSPQVRTSSRPGSEPNPPSTLSLIPPWILSARQPPGLPPLYSPIQVLQPGCLCSRFYCRPVRSSACARHYFLLRTYCSPCLDVFDVPSRLRGYRSYPSFRADSSSTQEGSPRVGYSGCSLCVATQDSQLIVFTWARSRAVLV